MTTQYTSNRNDRNGKTATDLNNQFYVDNSFNWIKAVIWTILLGMVAGGVYLFFVAL